MKAIVQDRFGPPDVLQFMDVDQPGIGPDDVLVRVHAAAVNPYDWHMLRGDPYVARLLGGVGLTRPKHRIAGADGAGRVERVGANVTDLRPGDEVLGWFDGSFAEYARAAADRVVPRPARLSSEEAAAIPMAGETALRAIRDVGRVQRGDRVLVNGAAGGVGHLAVQIAVALGAEVTGVCSTRNVELVRSLGAAHVVDYTGADPTAADFTDGRQQYDVVLDNVGNQPLHRVRRALTRNGTLVHNAGGSPGHVFGPIGSILRVVVAGALVSQRFRPLPSDWTREHLLAVAALVDAGQLTPVVDRTFPLSDTAAGLHHVEQGHARGKVVLTVL
jgi:NADPH:quinone reductase-like Zn-dependent oxidoreductase